MNNNTDYKNYIFSEYNKNIINNKNVELEVRFTEYNQERGVSLSCFNRLHQLYGRHDKKEIISMDYIYDNIRKSVYPDNKIEYMEKISKLDSYKSKVDEYNLKFGISIENIISKIENITSTTIVRQKNRISYFITPNIKLDITSVSMSDEYKNTKTIYEVEMELYGGIEHFDKWWSYIDVILKQIQNTDYIYTKIEYNNIIDHINSKLSGDTYVYNNSIRKLKDSLLMQAKSLKYNHLTSNFLTGKIRYRITIKSDGLRKLFIYYNNNFYFVMTHGEINKITLYDLDFFNGELKDLIIEGELIPENKIKKNSILESITSKYYYLIFDVLNLNTTSNVKLMDHNLRINIATKIVRILKQITANNEDNSNNIKVLDDALTINVKQFRLFTDSNEFFMTIRDLEINKLQLIYEEDGYILMPDNMPYNQKTEYPILKWKPSEKLTMDLAIFHRILPGNIQKVFAAAYEYNKLILSYNIDKNIINGSISSLLKSLGGISTIEYKNIQIYYLSIFDIKNAFINNSINILDIRKDDLNILFTYNNETKKYDIKLIKQKINDESTIYKVLNNTNKNNTQFICKVKFVKYSDNKYSMELYSSGGYNQLDFDLSETIKDSTKSLKDYPSETIFEFLYNENTKKLDSILLRSDKKYPNDFKVVQDIWSTITDPIYLTTITGKDLKLMRKYHNRIKRNIFNNNVNGIKFNGNKLLDLGSGKGGDIDKMNLFTKIILVEPNIEYITEMVDRIKKIGGNYHLIKSENDVIPADIRYLIINTGAENTNLITNIVNKFFKEPADVISSMLSLSFFWSDTTKFNALISTINNNLKIGGTFMYLTIDGDVVSQYFNPPKGLIPEPELKLLGGEITVKYLKDTSELYIDLPSSETVKEQTESLVLLDALRYNLYKFNYQESAYYHADQEGFMNTSEKLLSSMYSYGALTKY